MINQEFVLNSRRSTQKNPIVSGNQGWLLVKFGYRHVQWSPKPFLDSYWPLRHAPQWCKGRMVFPFVLLLASGLGGASSARAACQPVTPTEVICSGATTVEQNITDATTVQADSTFNVSTNAGKGLVVSGNGPTLSLTQGTGSIISGFEGGIDVRNDGTGFLNLLIQGEVSSAQSHAIRVYNGTAATDLTLDIKSAVIRGSDRGVNIQNEGMGETNVTVTGSSSVNGIDSTGTGLNVVGRQTTTDMRFTLQGGTISGGVRGISVFSFGTGSTAVDINGDVSASAAGSAGMSVSNNRSNENVSVRQIAGTIIGQDIGLAVSNGGNGATSVITAGTIVGGGLRGVFLYNAAGLNDGMTLEQTSGSITGKMFGIQGDFSQGSGQVTTASQVEATDGVGIIVSSSGLTSALKVVQTSGVITGALGGVLGFAINETTLDVDTRGGVIEATRGGYGVAGFTAEGAARIRAGEIVTGGSGAFGIAATSFARSQNAGSLQIETKGAVTAAGDDAGGVVAYSYVPTANTSTSGAVEISVDGLVSAMGRNSAGISATSGSGRVDVLIGNEGRVMGGWSERPDDVSGVFKGLAGLGLPLWVGSNLPAAGVVLYSGDASVEHAMQLENYGYIGAMNDRAIAMAYPCSNFFDGSITDTCSMSMPDVQSLKFSNSGTVDGYFSFLDGSTHVVENSGQVNLRNFADTNGDGIRDTKSVAVVNLGSVNNAGAGIFNNNESGVIKPGSVSDAAQVNTLGFYTPTTGVQNNQLSNTFYDLHRSNVSQGQIVNADTFTNAGTIDLRGTAVGNTLVITGREAVDAVPGAGTYVSSGGSLFLNTVLNAGVDDQSDASQSDLLIVDRTVTGQAGATTILVTNAGGSGAYTGGNGIELVEVRDSLNSSPDAFVLSGDYLTRSGETAIVAGAYAYTLNFGGTGADSTDGNWYLRSQLKADDNVPAEPELPPLYQSGVPVSEAYPQVLLGLNGLPTLQQRVGNRYWNDAPSGLLRDGKNATVATYASPAEGGSVTSSNGIWGRIEASHSQISSGSSTAPSEFNYDMYKLQAGLDGTLVENEAGRLIGGLTMHYVRGAAQSSSVYNTSQGGGEIRASGYGLGGTLTWYGDNGIYLDGQAQVTRYNSDLSIAGGTRSLTHGNDATGYALSLEGGKRIAVGVDWSFVPQLQLTWSDVSFDSFNDVFGARVSLNRGGSLQGRVGFALEHQASWYNVDGLINRSQLYGIANLYYEFLEGTKVTVSDTQFTSDNDRLWGGIGFGGAYNWNNDRYSIYGEGLLNTSLAGFGDSYSYHGALGFRMKW
ncbi:outer membrane autotransporter protein [Ochrobactrum sp. BH3]|nr:outer membrane autotransporter protein [Ochrobactrum sp. BH3]